MGAALTYARRYALFTMVGIDIEADDLMQLGGKLRIVGQLELAHPVRRLVELGLRVKTPTRPASKPGRRLRAQEPATKAIEKIIDPSAPPEERAQRRRRLIKGPIEFREDRVDLPKAKGK